MRSRSHRPQLKIELGRLGPVDPFGLELVEQPPGSGEFYLVEPGRGGPQVSLELAGLSLAGAGHALLGLSLRWMDTAGREAEPFPDSAFGEVRMVVRRKEARLLAALLRRHLDRLPQPPPWMPELLGSLEQIDEFLRWEER